MAQKLSKELATMAGELYTKLKSGHAVAKRLGVGSTTAYRLIQQSGVHVAERWGEEVSANRRKFQGEIAVSVTKDYQAGMTLEQLKKKYKSSDYAIRTAVRSAGIKLRDHGGQRRRLHDEEIDNVVSLYVEEKWSQQQIAAKLGCHQIVISRVLRQRGISKRRNSHDEHGSWKGGITVNGYGYVSEMIQPNDAMASMRSRTGYVLQHRLVMARHLGRPLLRSESIHHINGDKADNRIENLQLRHGKHGTGVCLHCADCGSTNITTKEL